MSGGRILVLDAASPISLAACESLSRAGYEVGLTCVSRLDLAIRSRHAARHHRMQPSEGPAQPYIDGLLTTIERWGYEAVVAVRDPAVARLLEHRLPVPSCPASSSSALAMIDKLKLAQVCRSCGVAYPATLAPSAPSEDAAALVALGFPAFVKTRRSAFPTPERIVHLPGARRVEDLGQGNAAICGIRALGAQPIVQENVTGDKLHAVTIMRGGCTLFRYAHRFLRELDSAEVALETLDPGSGAGAEAIEMLERVCAACGYEGLVQAEFSLAHRDRRLYLLDVNPRLWGSTWFPERIGLRIVERAVRDALREPPLPDAGYTAGLRSHHVLGELRWARANPRRLPSVIHTTRPGDIYHPSLADPLPVAFWLCQKLLSRRRGYSIGGPPSAQRPTARPVLSGRRCSGCAERASSLE